MKKTVLAIALAASIHTASAQENFKGKGASGTTSPSTAPVESAPVFLQGDVMAYIASQVSYPVKARDNGMQGTVWISFIVDSSGFVKDAKVEKGFDPECDAEALRVIKLMPRWKAGTIAGRTVPVKYTLPVKFTIVEKGNMKKKKKKDKQKDKEKDKKKD